MLAPNPTKADPFAPIIQSRSRSETYPDLLCQFSAPADVNIGRYAPDSVTSYSLDGFMTDHMPPPISKRLTVLQDKHPSTSSVANRTRAIVKPRSSFDRLNRSRTAIPQRSCLICCQPISVRFCDQHKDGPRHDSLTYSTDMNW